MVLTFVRFIVSVAQFYDKMPFVKSQLTPGKRLKRIDRYNCTLHITAYCVHEFYDRGISGKGSSGLK